MHGMATYVFAHQSLSMLAGFLELKLHDSLHLCGMVVAVLPTLFLGTQFP